jgi:hypothetical protein
MDIDYLIATAKGIKGLHLHHDTEMLNSILSKFTPENIERVQGIVLEEDIDN